MSSINWHVYNNHCIGRPTVCIKLEWLLLKAYVRILLDRISACFYVESFKNRRTSTSIVY